MSKAFKISIAILVPLGFALAAWWPWSPGGNQYLNMKKAERYLPRVQAIIDGDSRFKDLKVATYTGQDGSIGLFGHLYREDDMCDLMKAVARERLPITVAWLVTVHPADEANPDDK